jgi:hypothetical protein
VGGVWLRSQGCSNDQNVQESELERPTPIYRAPTSHIPVGHLTQSLCIDRTLHRRPNVSGRSVRSLRAHHVYRPFEISRWAPMAPNVRAIAFALDSSINRPNSLASNVRSNPERFQRGFLLTGRVQSILTGLVQRPVPLLCVLPANE